MAQQFSDTDEDTAVKSGNNGDFLKGERGMGDGAPAVIEDNSSYNKCIVSHIIVIIIIFPLF